MDTNLENFDSTIEIVDADQPSLAHDLGKSFALGVAYAAGTVVLTAAVGFATKKLQDRNAKKAAKQIEENLTTSN
jgi:hypothetical protein